MVVDLLIHNITKSALLRIYVECSSVTINQRGGCRWIIWHGEWNHEAILHNCRIDASNSQAWAAQEDYRSM